MLLKFIRVLLLLLPSVCLASCIPVADNNGNHNHFWLRRNSDPTPTDFNVNAQTAWEYVGIVAYLLYLCVVFYVWIEKDAPTICFAALCPLFWCPCWITKRLGCEATEWDEEAQPLNVKRFTITMIQAAALLE